MEQVGFTYTVGTNNDVEVWAESLPDKFVEGEKVINVD